MKNSKKKFIELRNFFKKSKIFTSVVKKFRIFKYFTFKDLLNFEKIKLFWITEPYTTIGYHRLTNAYELAKEMENRKINGAFVECGSWKGGCIATMAYVAEQAQRRKIWLFDSFCGLPEPGEIDGKLAKNFASGRDSGNLSPINECVASIKDVDEIFSKLQINKKNIIIEKGWLQNILPKAEKRIGDIAVLRLDVDWYESTKLCLDYLYDKVVSGGYVIIDDYGHWEGCKKATDEFLQKNRIKANLLKIDYTGRFFQKT